MLAQSPDHACTVPSRISLAEALSGWLQSRRQSKSFGPRDPLVCCRLRLLNKQYHMPCHVPPTTAPTSHNMSIRPGSSSWLVRLLALLHLSIHASAGAYHDPFIVSPPGSRPDIDQTWRPRDLGERVFSLRHVYHHGTHDYPDLHRYLDIPLDAPVLLANDDGTTSVQETKLRARAMSTNVERMTDRRRETVDSLLAYAGDWGHAMTLPSSA